MKECGIPRGALKCLMPPNATGRKGERSGVAERRAVRRKLGWLVLGVAFPIYSMGIIKPAVAASAQAMAEEAQQSQTAHSLDIVAIEKERILRRAQTALGLAPITITAFRARLSPGGPNDFYSNGDYWWPNPDTPDGLPYIQRDGQSNPNNFNAHRRCIMQLRDAVAALGAAYMLTRDDTYAAKAAELLRVFFIAPDTRMNPHLKYAQAIPGVTSGRGTGIIDTLHLVEIPLAVLVMQNSPRFPTQTIHALKEWFRDYTHWMLTSTNGQQEANTANNHAVAYWLQIAAFSLLTGQETNLVECRRRFKQVFVPRQMALDGSFPAELRRTKPYGYSIFQLDNMAALCQIASAPEDNLWAFELPDGRGMRKGMEFLYPFLADKSKWPYKPDVQAWEGWPVRQPCLLFAGLALQEKKYLELWSKLPPEPTDPEVRRNVAVTQPILWLKYNNFGTAAPPKADPAAPAQPG